MRKKPLAASPRDEPSIFPGIGSTMLFLLGTVLLIWSLIAYDLRRTYNGVFEQAHTQLENLTRVYAEEVSSSVKALNYVLIDLRDEWKDNPKQFGALVEARLVHLDPSIFGVGVTDAEGNLVFSRTNWQAAPVNLSDRDYFRFHLTQAGDDLFVEKPLLLRSNSRIAVIVSRPRTRPGGKFNGVVTLSVSPEYFSRFHEEIDLGRGSIISVARITGELIARSPRHGLAVDTTIQAAPWIEAAPDAYGLYQSHSEIDNVERLHAWRVLRDGRMVVIMAQSMDTLLEHYHQQRQTFTWWGGTATLFLLLIAYFIGSYRLQRARSLTAMRKMEEALARSQKLESIGKLTGGVAHDFNNILQIINSNVELLNLTVPEDPRIAPQLNSISGAVERGSRLAAQLLTFARRQPLHPSAINPQKLISNIDNLVQRLVGDDIEVNISAADNVWPIFADPALLENVILNLAANARDAMEGRGKLSISLSNESLDARRAAEYQNILPGDYVALAVTDTGSGMPPEVIERVFEPFFTTKPEGRGTGLGLAMAYGFVQESRGHIHISSRPGAGTTVRIFLPRAEQKEASPDASGSPDPAKGNAETILLVEDNAELRNMTAIMLEHLGYRVIKAANAEEALALLEKGEAIDVLFSDIGMPGPIDGLGLVERARDMHSDLSILITSGSDFQERPPEDALQSDYIIFLRKPYTIQEVAVTLRRLLSGKDG